MATIKLRPVARARRPKRLLSTGLLAAFRYLRPQERRTSLSPAQGCRERQPSTGSLAHGFFGATDEETRPHYANAFQETRAAMLSPFTASGVALRLTPIYANVPGHGAEVRSLINIDPHDLTFKPNADGSFQGKIKLLTAAFGPDNKQINATGFDYIIKIDPGRMDDVLRDGLLYNLSFQLPKPGGFQIRAAVRDEESHKTGSADEFIEIPDIRRKRFGLTSVVLANAPKAGSQFGIGAFGRAPPVSSRRSAAVFQFVGKRRPETHQPRRSESTNSRCER